MRIAIFENIMTPGGLEPSEEVACVREPCDGDAEAQEFDDCLGGDLYGVDEGECLKGFGGDLHDTFPIASDGEVAAALLDVCAFLGDVGKAHGAVSFPQGSRPLSMSTAPCCEGERGYSWISRASSSHSLMRR